MPSATFRTLGERNVKLFLAGLAVSNVGTWIQATALILLVRSMGGTGVSLGIVTACQFLPMLLFGLWSGALADRVDRRRLTIITQTALGVQAIILGVLDLAGMVSLPVVYALTLVLGIFSAVDNPSRRGFATELVDKPDLGNILSLNTSVMTGSRIFGPALAALLVAFVGTGWCFIINGVSFLALLSALFAIDTTRLRRPEAAPRSATPVRDGLRVVWADPVLRITVMVYAVVATFAFNTSVSLPLIVRDRLGAPDRLYGWLLSTISVGSLIGSLGIARLRVVRQRFFYGAVSLLSLGLIIQALSTSVSLTFVSCIPLGMGAASFVSAANVIMQDRTGPQTRSRVLALGAVLFLGSTPIGGPITGIIGDTAGPAWATSYGALIALVAAGLGVMAVRRLRARPAAGPATEETAVIYPSP